MTTAAPIRIRLGVSACLLGQEVRYNKGHCLDRWLTRELGRYVDFIPVCPEIEAGLGVPRPTLRLIGDPDGPHDALRVLESNSDTEHTDALRAHAATRTEQLQEERLDGYVLKSKSPSCGLWRVKVYPENGMPRKAASGIFAHALEQRFPGLPIEEEGRLNDPVLRENFVLRVFTVARWNRLRAGTPSKHALEKFHAQHKMMLLAHDPTAYQELGRMVAGKTEGDLEDLLDRYEKRLKEGLACIASRGRHYNVLQHLAGFIKDSVDAEEKRDLGEVLASYREGHTPLSVPVTLLRHLLRRHATNPWVLEQTYLEPYPHDLSLRNYT
jgi:uncharacterized protein YbgA (DUF1722 family)/uncharacterized protein YbbK (DUF523 family)